MSQSATPNLIEFYEGARGYLLPILAAVKPEQLGDPTPCTKWNIQNLLIHNVKVAEFFYGVITGAGKPDRLSMFAVDGPLPREGVVSAFEAITNRILDAASAPGAMDRVVSTGLGEAPVSRVLMAPVTDMTLHKWDLAKATNQDAALDGALAEACYHSLAKVVEGARQRGTFGPEVEVRITASIQDKFLGLSGRQP